MTFRALSTCRDRFLSLNTRGEGTLPWIWGLRTRPALQAETPRQSYSTKEDAPMSHAAPPSLRTPSGSPRLCSLLQSRDHGACSLHPSTVGLTPRAPPFLHWPAPVSQRHQTNDSTALLRMRLPLPPDLRPAVSPSPVAGRQVRPRQRSAQ